MTSAHGGRQLGEAGEEGEDADISNTSDATGRKRRKLKGHGGRRQKLAPHAQPGL